MLFICNLNVREGDESAIFRLSRTHAVGFHYETYVEISQDPTLYYTLVQFVFAVSDIDTKKCILHRGYGEMG